MRNNTYTRRAAWLALGCVAFGMMNAPRVFAADAGFNAFVQRAEAAGRTPAGRAWERSLNPVFKPIWQRAMRECPRPSIFTIMRGLHYRFAMLVDAQGRVTWSAAQPSNHTTECVRNMMAAAQYPAPPTSAQPFVLDMHINKKPQPRAPTH